MVVGSLCEHARLLRRKYCGTGAQGRRSVEWRGGCEERESGMGGNGKGEQRGITNGSDVGETRGWNAFSGWHMGDDEPGIYVYTN